MNEQTQLHSKKLHWRSGRARVWQEDHMLPMPVSNPVRFIWSFTPGVITPSPPHLIYLKVPLFFDHEIALYSFITHLSLGRPFITSLIMDHFSLKVQYLLLLLIYSFMSYFNRSSLTRKYDRHEGKRRWAESLGTSMLHEFECYGDRIRCCVEGASV